MVGQNSNLSWWRRRILVVDKQMQMTVILFIVASMLITALACAAALLVFPGENENLKFTGRDAASLAMKINLVYFCFSLVSLVWITLVWTHRFAGPAMVLERALEGMLEGRLDQRVGLRDKDQLKGLAAALSEFQEQIRTERENICASVDEIDQAIERGDTEGARATLRQLAPRARRATAAEEPLSV